MNNSDIIVVHNRTPKWSDLIPPYPTGHLSCGRH